MAFSPLFFPSVCKLMLQTPRETFNLKKPERQTSQNLGKIILDYVHSWSSRNVNEGGEKDTHTLSEVIISWAMLNILFFFFSLAV